MNKELLDLMKLQGEIRILCQQYGAHNPLNLAGDILHKIVTSDVASEKYRQAYQKANAAVED